MEIVEVSMDNIEDLFYPCGPEKNEYVSQKKYLSNLWVRERFKNNWKGYVAYDEDKPVGRVEFYPVESGFVLLSGKDFYFMPCIWVLPEFQKKLIGEALIEKVIEETKDRSGVLTYAMESQGWMPSSFFLKYGFEDTGLSGLSNLNLLLKKHREAELPKLLKPTFEHMKDPNRVVIEVIEDPVCPFMRVWQKQMIDIAQTFKEKFNIVEYSVKNRNDALKYGYSTVYVDGEEPFFEPASAEEIRVVLENHLKKKKLI
jgi:GNAT superfamily N-acetyltransferase